MKTPYYSAEANDYQSTIHKGAEADLAELCSNAALEYITNWMECWVVRIANEVYLTVSIEFEPSAKS